MHLILDIVACILILLIVVMGVAIWWLGGFISFLVTVPLFFMSSARKDNSAEDFSDTDVQQDSGTGV